MSEEKKQPHKVLWILLLLLVAAVVCVGVLLLRQRPTQEETISEATTAAEEASTEETTEAVEEASTEETTAAEEEESLPADYMEWQKGASFDVGLNEGTDTSGISTAELDAATDTDICGWLYLSAADVDDAVYRKMGTSNPYDDYYLYHNPDGSEGYPGCIYMEPLNSPRFTDNITVLYGHNMKDGSAFGELRYFRDESFFDENRFFYIVTGEAVLTYRIYAAKVIDAIRPTTAFGTDKEGKTKEYLDYLQSCSTGFVDDEMSPSDADHLVVLQTCCGNDDLRYDVVGVLVSAELR